jgi:hypothetical protein
MSGLVVIEVDSSRGMGTLFAKFSSPLTAGIVCRLPG